MRCQPVIQLYDEYVRGALPVETLTRIEEHLSTCATCRRRYDHNDRLAQLLVQSHEVAHPGPDYFESLTSRVLARLDDPEDQSPAASLPEPHRVASGMQRPVWWMGAAAACALATLGLMGEPMLPTARYERQVAEARRADFPSASPIAITEAGGRRSLLFDNNFGLSIPVLTEEQVRQLVELNLPPADGKAGDLAGLPPAGAAVDQPRDPAADGTTIRTVAMRPLEQEPAEQIAEELNLQFELIRERMTAEGDEALQRGLDELSQLLQERSSTDLGLESLPAVRQVRLFREAQEALRSGRPREAWTRYRRIVMIDAGTPLAYRANLQLADLYYSEWADFKEATAFYEAAKGLFAEKYLTPTELDHIARQLDRLNAHRANDWQALSLQHQVHHDDWPQAVAALRELVQLADAGDLLPETARVLVDRMADSRTLQSSHAIEVYKLLENRAASEQNGSVRAWLELALGDMQLAQFQSLQAAIQHYSQAMQAGGDSSAGRLAATKREQLIDRQLLELVR